jgi:methylenetetrahydrofolate reductase (NADPH)
MPYDSTASLPTEITATHPFPAPSGVSLEITPGVAAKVDDFRTLLPAGTSVYVTNLPGTDARQVVALCRRLRDQGMRPVPHLAARGLDGRGTLATWLGRMVGEGGAQEILLIAGSGERPLGPYRDTLDVLQTGLIERAGLSGLGIGGHPEGHPQADAARLLEALRTKQDFAAEHGLEAWVVTQFTFSAKPVLGWAEGLAAAGITLPVRVGLPGPAKPATLINYARQCGVGASLRVLTRRPDVMAGLLRAWTPDTILADLIARGRRDGGGRIAGVHLFPFGGFAKAAGWAATALPASEPARQPVPA